MSEFAPLALVRCRRGSMAVETAFVAPLIVLVLFAAMELARIGWTQAALQYGVEEAARCVAVRPTVCATAAQTAAFAAQRAAAPQLPASVFTVGSQACGWQVTGAVRHQFILKAIFPAPVLSARSCRP